MKKSAERFFVLAQKASNGYWDESRIVDGAYTSSVDVSVDARALAARNPGVQFFVFEAVGMYESRILPSTFTSFAERPMLALPRYNHPAPESSDVTSEDLLR